MMKNILFYAIPAALALAACNKDKPVTQGTTGTPAVVTPAEITLTLSDLKKATATSGTALGATVALSATAEFAVTGSPVKAGEEAKITVNNAQLPVVTAKGSVVGVVKLTLGGVTEADEVSVKLKETAKGGAAVRVVADDVPTTGALKDGKLDKLLTTTAEKHKGKALYLLFQSGENGFSVADKAEVEITAKDKKFTVTVVGDGSAKLAENQTTVNKVMARSDDTKIASIKSGATKIDAPAALNSTAAEFSVFPKKGSTDEDFNIAITKTKKADFKAADGGKIGIVQLIFTNAKKLASGSSSDPVTFTAKIKSVFANGSKCKVALVNVAPVAEKELLATNALKDNLEANGKHGTKDKWADYSTTGSGEASTNTSKNTWLLFQGATEGFADGDVVIVEITATVGEGDNKATKTFTVKISVADVAAS